MTFSPGARAATLLLLLSFGGAAVQAQRAVPRPTAPAVAATPAIDPTAWLYKGSDITPDPAWRFGTLPNGLRYAVRRNGVPPGQVSIRVRIDAGSLHEDDSERGFAHFVEHLSYRASRHVPDGEAKRIFQNFGATFGSDTNATTSPVSTTYKLDLPSATPDRLDQSLRILAGMMAAPVLNEQTINAERPVVLAEQRELPGPQLRLQDARSGVFFAGQPLADRSPIGTIKTLQAASAASVKAFHDRWYRPERTVVILSGDLDPAVLGQMVAKNFADWRGTGPAPAEPDFGRPDPSKPATGAIAEPGLPSLVQMAVLRPWRFNADTVVFNQRRMVDSLAARVISRRLESRARAGGSFLQASVALDDVVRSANLTQVSILPIGADWAAALKDVRAVIADALATAPSQAEIDREYTDYETALRNQVDTARVEASARQADDVVEALDIRETVAAPETSYAILKDARAKGMFNPEALLASTRKLFQGDATRAIVNTPQPDADAAKKLLAALTADVSGAGVTRRAQAAVSFDALPPLGAPGKVTAREKIPELDMERVEFANGVRMLLYPSPSETGRVYVRVRFGGGYAALPRRASPAWAGDLALVQSGVGKLDQSDLDQLLAGRVIGLDFNIDADAFSLNALTSPRDLDDQLRLMAAKLATPNWDPAPIARAKAVKQAGQASYDASPDGVLARDLEGLLRDGDPRWTQPSAKQVQALTPDRFRRFWEPLLASGPIEVSVFGDVKADTAIAAVAASFGALPPRAAAPRRHAEVRFPKHRDQPVTLTHGGSENQAAAVIAWPTGGGVEGIRDGRRLDVLAQVFSDRLFERLRQTAGASYSPNVSSAWPVGLDGGGRMLAIGQVTPDKVPYFFQLAREIAADLAANPIPEAELQRIMRPIAQYIVRASSGNQFWLQQLGGGAYDQRRIDATRALAQDFVSITAAELQQVAAKYLRPERDWTLAVVPRAGQQTGAAPSLRP
jgi:zinc protease